MVRLSIKNFRFKNGRKLVPCYILIKIIIRISNQAYKVRLPEKYYCIYNVVLMSFLEPWITPYDLKKTPFPNLKDDQEVYKLKFIKIYNYRYNEGLSIPYKVKRLAGRL